MKIIHQISTGDYEFISFEYESRVHPLEKSEIEYFDELYRTYHKRGDKLVAKEREERFKNVKVNGDLEEAQLRITKGHENDERHEINKLGATDYTEEELR